MIKGKAEIEFTDKLSRRISEKNGMEFNVLGRTGLKVSQAGFGCYRIHYEVKEHYKSLFMALKEGINLIDTSTNYGFGGSELLVGRIMFDMIKDNIIKREEIVILTKIGYVQGPAMEIAKERKSSGNDFPDMVYYSDDCWHCISPEYLEDQINRSIERLNVEKIDILLLHNPEYFLSISHKYGMDMEESRKIYYERIERAFVFLEKEVEKGRISWYGISSNTFPLPSEEYEHTSLEKVWAIANNISPDNHFAVIQFPLNLYEPGAVLNKNQKDNTSTIIEFAGEINSGVLINRPLNSFPANRLIRLSDFNPMSQAIHRELDKYLPKYLKASSLSAKSIWMLRSLPSVSNVLIGMRREEYVEDVLKGLTVKRKDSSKIWEEFHTLD